MHDVNAKENWKRYTSNVYKPYIKCIKNDKPSDFILP